MGPSSLNAFDQEGSIVTHACCPPCRLRFTPAAAAYVKACPQCGEQPQQITGREALGFRLLGPEGYFPLGLPRKAIAVSIPAPDT